MNQGAQSFHVLTVSADQGAPLRNGAATQCARRLRRPNMRCGPAAPL